MMRKDCEFAGRAHARSGGTRSERPPRSLHATRLTLTAAWFTLLASSPVFAGTLRLWPAAVVVEDALRIDELCELRGFDPETERRLSKLKVADAPAPGGSRLVSIELIRSALTAGGANLAQITLSGATQCAVSRPDRPAPTPDAKAGSQGSKPSTKRSTDLAAAPATEAPPTHTLRQAVIDHFNAEFARYTGTAEVVFDRTSEQVLDLSGPSYEFKIRRRGQPLGLCPMEVEVVSAGRSVQTVPLVAQVSLIRRAVVARRTINQDAAVQPADVESASLTFTRLDKLGVDELAAVVGQRAKRVIPAGSLLEAEMLESVPLVLRGQLVTLTSVAGGIRVVTTAKAAQDGRFGDLIKVRSVDDKRLEFDAQVAAPGEVRLGVPSREAADEKLALGGQP